MLLWRASVAGIIEGDVMPLNQREKADLEPVIETMKLAMDAETETITGKGRPEQRAHALGRRDTLQAWLLTLQALVRDAKDK